MSKYTEAKYLFHHNNLTFEQEKIMNKTIDEALEIAYRLEQADARQNVGKRLGEMEEWVRVSTNEHESVKANVV